MATSKISIIRILKEFVKEMGYTITTDGNPGFIVIIKHRKIKIATRKHIIFVREYCNVYDLVEKHTRIDINDPNCFRILRKAIRHATIENIKIDRKHRQEKMNTAAQAAAIVLCAAIIYFIRHLL